MQERTDNKELISELISKKELLEITGISYGQLYRWKRERLIPEEWFIKQPSFTGQETFMPKSRIIERVRMIQEGKDKYSLPELADMLSPEQRHSFIGINELEKIKEIDIRLMSHIRRSSMKESYSLLDTVIFMIISELAAGSIMPPEAAYGLVNRVASATDSLGDINGVFMLMKADGNYYAAVRCDSAEIYFDSGMQTVYEKPMSEIAAQIKLKYDNLFKQV